jgi:hypothetical protein
MAEYKVSAILWQDHYHFNRQSMVKNPEKAISPTLSVGIVYKETKNTITLVSEIERYEEHDDTSFLIILKNSIISSRDYGVIELKKIRT